MEYIQKPRPTFPRFFAWIVFLFSFLLNKKSSKLFLKLFFLSEIFFIPACFYYFCIMKFSLIFPLPSSSNWKNDLTKKEIKKIIRNNDKRLKDDAKIK